MIDEWNERIKTKVNEAKNTTIQKNRAEKWQWTWWYCSNSIFRFQALSCWIFVFVFCVTFFLYHPSTPSYLVYIIPTHLSFSHRFFFFLFVGALLLAASLWPACNWKKKAFFLSLIELILAHPISIHFPRLPFHRFYYNVNSLHLTFTIVFSCLTLNNIICMWDNTQWLINSFLSRSTKRTQYNATRRICTSELFLSFREPFLLFLSLFFLAPFSFSLLFLAPFSFSLFFLLSVLYPYSLLSVFSLNASIFHSFRHLK